jgi:hydrogenase expression/formation protein HypC
MKLVSVSGAEAIVESKGLRKQVNVSFLENARAGEYVIIHAGFAIERVKADEARRTLRMLRDFGRP